MKVDKKRVQEEPIKIEVKPFKVVKNHLNLKKGDFIRLDKRGENYYKSIKVI